MCRRCIGATGFLKCVYFKNEAFLDISDRTVQEAYLPDCFGVLHNRQEFIQSKVIIIYQNRQKWYLLYICGTYQPGFIVVVSVMSFCPPSTILPYFF